MLKGTISLLVVCAVLISVSPQMVFASDPLVLNATEFTIYALNSSLEGFQTATGGVVTMPANAVTSAQIKILSGAEGKTVTFRETTGAFNVSADGLVTPAPKYYTGNSYTRTEPETYDYIGYDYGSRNIAIYLDGRFAQNVKVILLSYTNIYVSEELDKVAAEIMETNEGNHGLLLAICQYVASFDYGKNPGTAGFILYGYGDCWASTNTIIELALRCGMRAKSRSANRDPGSGNGHANAVVEVDGIPYVAEAGYDRMAPRPYYATPYPTGFMLDFTNLAQGAMEAKIFDHIGFGTEIVIPAEINRGVYFRSEVPTTETIKISAVGTLSFRSSAAEKVTISEGIETIETNCFDLSDLRELNIPASVSTIGAYPFIGLDTLTNVTIAIDNPYYEIRDSLILSRDGTVLVACLPGKEGMVRIPDSVEIVKNGAFIYCKKITKIIFSRNIESIGREVCAYTSALTEIVISEGTQGIEGRAFLGAANSEGSTPQKIKVEIPKSVNEIAGDAFNNTVYYPTIIGYPGSYAEQYANEKGFTFLDIATNSISKLRCNILITNLNYDSPTKKISADISVSNISEGFGGTNIIIAVYDNSRKLLVFKMKMVDFDDKQTKVISFSEAVENVRKPYTIKAFAWSADNRMEPFTSPAIVNIN